MVAVVDSKNNSGKKEVLGSQFCSPEPQAAASLDDLDSELLNEEKSVDSVDFDDYVSLRSYFCSIENKTINANGTSKPIHIKQKSGPLPVPLESETQESNSRAKLSSSWPISQSHKEKSTTSNRGSIAANSPSVEANNIENSPLSQFQHSVTIQEAEPLQGTYDQNLGDGTSNAYIPEDRLNHSSAAGSSKRSLVSKLKSLFTFRRSNSGSHNPSHGVCISPRQGADIARTTVNEEVLRRFQEFKHFDYVDDYSDHKFVSRGSSTEKPPKSWTKIIQREWKILESSLPDSIFVRVYETRMDLLRVVIVGAEGTPYHDGLYFFDVFFPIGYPKVPPNVHFHSGGLSLNPNLYSSGAVCLSLLGTWVGLKNEMWIPDISTVLQVLVSIQGLILNKEPYFNEPYLEYEGFKERKLRSNQYNEIIFSLSLKSMVYTMRKPPKHFEDFVVGHFYMRAHDILATCKAYTDGAEVGSVVKGGTQRVHGDDNSCSMSFRKSLPHHIDMLVKELSQLGIKDVRRSTRFVKMENYLPGLKCILSKEQRDDQSNSGS